MKNKRNLIIVIIWMLIIFIMSSFNSTQSSNQSNFIVDIIANIFNITNTSTLSIIIRKLAHYTEYLILGILVINLNNNKNKGLYLSMIVCLLSILICIIYAISDELHQSFVPGRSCQLVDVTIDFIGALTGIFIYKQTRNSNQ